MLCHHCGWAEHGTTCSPTQNSSFACTAPESGKNRTKAGSYCCGKSLAEHVLGKLHPLQTNQAEWQIFSLSRGKQPASLLSSLSVFSLGENKLYSRLFFRLSPQSEWPRDLSLNSSLHWGSRWVPVFPVGNKLLCPHWYLRFLPKQWRAKTTCNLANAFPLPWPGTGDREAGKVMLPPDPKSQCMLPPTHTHFPENFLIQGAF